MLSEYFAREKESAVKLFSSFPDMNVGGMVFHLYQTNIERAVPYLIPSVLATFHTPNSLSRMGFSRVFVGEVNDERKKDDAS